MKQYNFHLSGEKGIYEVAFSIDDENIESACVCNYQSDKNLCWHKYYILAGKNQRIPAHERQAQQDLIFQLSKTPGGSELVSFAKATFGEKEVCRRCNRSEIIELKKGILGPIIGLFLPKGRHYFCWSCRWSW